MKITYLFLLIIILYTSSTYSIELSSAALCDGNPNTKSQSALDAGKIIGEVYKNNNLKSGRCLGWTNLGSGDVWYEATKKMYVNSVNVNSSQLLGQWPLTRWPYLQPPSEITSSLKNVSIKKYKSNISHISNRRTSGCLAQTPLRYGDVEGDGVSELVLFLNGELIIFSPEQQRTVFSSFWQADDWDREFNEYNNKVSVDDDKAYQYASAAMAIKGWPYKAMRSYSKIFEGSFDQDTHPDILVWEKVYESNTTEEAPGFKLLRSSLKHYERDLTAQAELPDGVTGEYLPQTTDEAVIQSWLADKNLTWQKGYPNLSECPGQEAQLIPEMHDSQLNDPDVLQ